MLVLSRRQDERLELSISHEELIQLAKQPEGLNISLTVAKCSNGRVSLGLDAPKAVKILRSELSTISSPPLRRVPATRQTRATRPSFAG